MLKLTDIHYDCRFFKGDIPCKPNKLRGKTCPTCDEFEPIKTRILMIKLGAAGDVIRTTPLITRFRETYPNAHITWLTHSPELVPTSVVDKISRFDFMSVYSATHLRWDIAINLDKDIEACALLQDVFAIEKYGFILKDGHISTANHLADHKFFTGLFDDLSKTNTKNYLTEIFEICGFEFKGEKYILDINESLNKKWSDWKTSIGNKKIIGLNTGCGDRWQTRLWPESYWIDLILKLQKDGYFPLLMGGPSEDLLNKMYAEKTGAYYPGTFSLKEFVAISNQCDVIITAVSMMMHIALGLKKPLVLFHNIFNRHEFELYGHGTMIEPPTGCECYFGNSCSRERHCMLDIPVETVYHSIKAYL